MPNKTFEADLVSTRRLINSASGNPRYALKTRQGVFRTSPDADCNYGVKDDGDTEHRVRLTLDAKDLVVDIEYLP